MRAMHSQTTSAPSGAQATVDYYQRAEWSTVRGVRRTKSPFEADSTNSTRSSYRRQDDFMVPTRNAPATEMGNNGEGQLKRGRPEKTVLVPPTFAVLLPGQHLDATRDSIAHYTIIESWFGFGPLAVQSAWLRTTVSQQPTMYMYLLGGLIVCLRPAPALDASCAPSAPWYVTRSPRGCLSAAFSPYPLTRFILDVHIGLVRAYLLIPLGERSLALCALLRRLRSTNLNPSYSLDCHVPFPIALTYDSMYPASQKSQASTHIWRPPL